MPKSYEAKLREAEEQRRPRDEEPLYAAIEGVPQRILVGFDHPETLKFELQNTYVEDTITIDELHDHLMNEVMKIQHEHNRPPLKCDYSRKHLYFDRLYMRPRAYGRELTLQDYGFRPGYRVKLSPFYGSESMLGAPYPTKPEAQLKSLEPAADPVILRRIDKGAASPARQLFCFPWLGGNVETFSLLGKFAPKDMAVYAFQLPGRGDREKDESYPSGEHVTKVYAMSMVAQMKKKPNANYFYGHSQGTHFAYYTMKVLQRDYGIVPKGFFISNFPCPLGQLPRDFTNIRMRQQSLNCLKVFMNLVKQGWGLDPKMAYKSHMGMCNYQLEDYWPAAKMVMQDWFMTFDFPLPNAEDPCPCPVKAIHGVGDKAVPTAQVLEWKAYTSDPAQWELVETEGEHLWWMGNNTKGEWLMKTLDGFMKSIK
jgi:surfactin synthase thioesterase subunit